MKAARTAFSWPEVSRDASSADASLALSLELVLGDRGARLRKRGGRKLIVVPEGATAWAPPRARVDSAMLKAIARGHRWRRLIESGEYASTTELAAAEKINQSYVCRVLRLTLLAPEIVEAILDGRQPVELMLANLMQSFPVGWQEQVEGWISVSRISGRRKRRRVGIARAASPGWAKRCDEAILQLSEVNLPGSPLAPRVSSVSHLRQRKVGGPRATRLTTGEDDPAAEAVEDGRTSVVRRLHGSRFCPQSNRLGRPSF